MEVKNVSPVAFGTPRPQPNTARSSGAVDAPAQPDPASTKVPGEISGQLARRLLADSGIKQADMDRFRVKLDIDGDTGRVVAEVRNRETNELVTEVPSRKLLRHAAMLKETLGMILEKPV